MASSSSSEKVYHVAGSKSGSNASNNSLTAVSGVSGKASSGPFGLMETVKEKLDNVRGRKRSKEPGRHHGYNTDGEVIDDYNNQSSQSESFKTRNNDATMALAELDSVLNFHSNSSSNSKANSSSKKKRNKEFPTSFRNGGTWPRTKCGPVIDYGTGTIIHPQKVKKERLPLAELLNNVPKLRSSSNDQGAKKVKSRAILRLALSI